MYIGKNLLVPDISSNMLMCFVESPYKEDETLGTVELAALIAGPICLVCIIAMVILYVIQQRRINDMRRSPYEHGGVESNSLLMPSQQTLHELLDEWSNSGSGSGERSV